VALGAAQVTAAAAHGACISVIATSSTCVLLLPCMRLEYMQAPRPLPSPHADGGLLCAQPFWNPHAQDMPAAFTVHYPLRMQ
jgi:hypothetical protein